MRDIWTDIWTGASLWSIVVEHYAFRYAWRRLVQGARPQRRRLSAHQLRALRHVEYWERRI